ncbi:MAG TPA: SET domain-containing protein-lysine N-methyltransferase [Steroidobacteraceae bacterium]|nr:SET domain-containing protein-lysine N-methyltransferase [Steroidobacteraceae bacterium]
MARARRERTDLVEVRRSRVHGRGAFATGAIRKGTRLIEYLGERVSHAEADRRYETKDENDSHTFLFIVDGKTVIDAGVDGNEARFFNHSCEPNCESVIENRRVYIEAIRAVQPGEELTYDYQIGREPDDPPNVDEIFACRCGFESCRGTMLWPAKRPASQSKRKRKIAQKKKETPSRNSGTHKEARRR